MKNIPLYLSDEAKALPSGLYLGLFHGRDAADQHMEDWGFNGPMIGPIQAFHVSYNDTLQVGFDNLIDAHKFFPDTDDEWVYLNVAGDCIEYDGKFYGDWTVHLHTQTVGA